MYIYTTIYVLKLPHSVMASLYRYMYIYIHIYMYIYIHIHIYIYITIGSPCASKTRLLGTVATELSTISASIQGGREHQ